MKEEKEEEEEEGSEREIIKRFDGLKKGQRRLFS